MSLDTATVRRIASLARLHMEAPEVERMQNELNGILGWIEQLQGVNTDGVEPMSGGAPQGEPAMRQRADVVTDGGIAEQVLANAPDRVHDYFAVPKVVE